MGARSLFFLVLAVVSAALAMPVNARPLIDHLSFTRTGVSGERVLLQSTLQSIESTGKSAVAYGPSLAAFSNNSQVSKLAPSIPGVQTVQNGAGSTAAALQKAGGYLGAGGKAPAQAPASGR